MPNWCFNRLTLTGPRGDLLTFAGDACGTVDGRQVPLSLEALYPGPDLLQPGSESLGHHRRRMWGTKWDIEHIDFEDRESSLVYDFDSAWMPPIPWLRHIAEGYPAIEFELGYTDPSLGFAGRLSCIGRYTVEEYYTEDPRDVMELADEVFGRGHGFFGEEDE